MFAESCRKRGLMQRVRPAVATILVATIGACRFSRHPGGGDADLFQDMVDRAQSERWHGEQLPECRRGGVVEQCVGSGQLPGRNASEIADRALDRGEVACRPKPKSQRSTECPE